MARVRNLIAVLAIVFAALGPAASPALAAFPVNDDCDHLTSGFYFGGAERGNNFITTIYADLYGDPGRFQPCTNPVLNEHSSVWQFIAIESPSSNPNEILQIGYIMCTPNNTVDCQGHSGLNYFWAYGRANNCPIAGSATPTARWLGSVPLVGVPPAPGYHHFQITRSADPAKYILYLYIDGVQKASISPDAVCWSNSNLNRAGWVTERHDPNDGFGGAGPVWFQGMRYGHDWQAVLNPNFTTSSCNLDPEFSCSVSAPDKVGFRTTQQ